MQKLITLVDSTFPTDKMELLPDLLSYWPIRDSLYVVDGVILMRDRIVLTKTLRNDAIQGCLPGDDRIIVPPALRGEIVNSLHAAYQGVNAMNERARAGVYWPGITTAVTDKAYVVK